MKIAAIVLSVASFAALAACSSSTTQPGGGTQPPPPPASITYYKDVKPITDAKCGTCHTQGGIAPFALQTYDDFAAQKDAIRAAVSARIMPPWLAAKGCTDYVADRSLSDDQIATLTGFVDQGLAKGDPAEYVAPVMPPAGLQRVDATIAMKTAFTPSVQPDEYRCFLVDWAPTTTKFVTGVNVQPGTASIVHHVIAYIAGPSDVAALQMKDGADGRPGYECFGGPGTNTAGMLAGWAPGARGGEFPANTGVRVAAGSKIIVQVHYNTSNAAPQPDLTKIDISWADSIAKEAYQLPFVDPNWVAKGTMQIPPHSQDVVHKYSSQWLDVMSYITGGAIKSNQPVTVYSAANHQHTRGTKSIFSITHANGQEECMLNIPQWNFHWQGAYGFVNPKTYAPGDLFNVECHWDNNGDTMVNWGEGTGDEMCISFVYVTQ